MVEQINNQILGQPLITYQLTVNFTIDFLNCRGIQWI